MRQLGRACGLMIAGASTLAGCNRAQFESARAERRAHIQRNFDLMEAREAGRAENLRELSALREARSERRVDRREFPYEVMRARRARRELGRERRTSEFLDLFRRGDTARIPGTFGKMFF